MSPDTNPIVILPVEEPPELHRQSGQTLTDGSVSVELKPQRARPKKSGTLPSENASKDEFDRVPRSEREGYLHFQKLKAFIEKHKGQYLKAEDGSLQLVIEGRRIRLENDPQDYGLINLMLRACKVTTQSPGARAAIQRLQNHANEQAAKMRFRLFSAMSVDGKAIYIPIEIGKLLRITSDKIEEVSNGDNVDSLWLEHPYGEPLNFQSSDVSVGLAHFERLVVESQSCKQPELKWLVAMQEGLLPFIRDAFPARFITLHIGPSQHGKTTGAQMRHSDVRTTLKFYCRVVPESQRAAMESISTFVPISTESAA